MSDPTDETKIACPHCGQHILIESSMLGTELQCPACKQSFMASEADAMEEKPATEPPVREAGGEETSIRSGIKTPLRAAWTKWLRPAACFVLASLWFVSRSVVRLVVKVVRFPVRVFSVRAKTLFSRLVGSGFLQRHAKLRRVGIVVRDAIRSFGSRFVVRPGRWIGLHVFRPVDECWCRYETARASVGNGGDADACRKPIPSLKRRIAYAATALVAVAAVVVAGSGDETSAGNSGIGSSNGRRARSRKAGTAAALTQSEREAIGKIFYSLATMEANKSKIASELANEYDAASADILLAASGSVIADSLENEDGWNDCPSEFKTAIKNSCIAKGKSEISAVVEKHGRKTVRDTLDRFNVHENFRKYFEEVMEQGPSSVSRELERSQSAFRTFMEEYGLGVNDIQTSATREFVQQRMSASGLCKEFVGSNPHCTIVDDHTAQWDVGGETPPFICEVSFSDDGTATLVQDNTFFARDYGGTSASVLAARLEQSFPRANPGESEIKNVKAFVRDGHLYFSGEIKVEPGNVDEKVTQVFKALNQARLRLRFL